ncbi:hypothetical protein [Cuevavirus lloviuense]|uniref:Uncharacterized protein n=1 Tax=Cuevavirus lloviuense TaxID=3052148 RepID=A0ACD3VMP7_9MONO|nr:hypothetical protein [Cuevavirus lloviuense]UKR35332.1 hypothetical protein [Cuevavirus lloviuense]
MLYLPDGRAMVGQPFVWDFVWVCPVGLLMQALNCGGPLSRSSLRWCLVLGCPTSGAVFGCADLSGSMFCLGLGGVGGLGSWEEPLSFVCRQLVGTSAQPGSSCGVWTGSEGWMLGVPGLCSCSFVCSGGALEWFRGLLVLEGVVETVWLVPYGRGRSFPVCWLLLDGWLIALGIYTPPKGGLLFCSLVW